MDDFGSANTTYSFTGIPGSGTTSTAGTNTITETATSGSHSETVVFTAETGNAGLYQITSVTHGTASFSPPVTATSPTFAFQYNAATLTTTVSETITGSYSSESKTFTSGAGGNANSYWLSADTITITNPSTTLPNGTTDSYSFGTAGSITETVTWGMRSFSHTETAIPTATFTGVGSATVSESYISGHGVTTVTFTGSSTAGYAVQQVSTIFVPQNSAATALDVNPCDRANFDLTAGTVSWIRPNGTAATAQSLTANSHVSFADLGKGGLASGDFIGETVTFGSHASFEVFYSSTGSNGSEYMEVAHGSGQASAVDVIGLASQLTALNQLHSLIT